jgi:hypothetical protein
MASKYSRSACTGRGSPDERHDSALAKATYVRARDPCSSDDDGSQVVYRWIDCKVYLKSTGRLTAVALPRDFRTVNSFTEEYHQHYRGKKL